MQYKDLMPKLEKSKSLPDDLTIRLNFEPPPPIPLTCKQCGNTRNVALSWDDIDQELQSGRHKPDDEYILYTSCCEKCEPQGEEDDE